MFGIRIIMIIMWLLKLLNEFDAICYGLKKKIKQNLPMSVATFFSHQQFVFLSRISIPIGHLKIHPNAL